MSCLNDCVQEQPVFKQDLRRLKVAQRDCCWINEIPLPPKRRKPSSP
jgi:hypothetical protein